MDFVCKTSDGILWHRESKFHYTIFGIVNPKILYYTLSGTDKISHKMVPDTTSLKLCFSDANTSNG